MSDKKVTPKELEILIKSNNKVNTIKNQLTIAQNHHTDIMNMIADRYELKVSDIESLKTDGTIVLKEQKKNATELLKDKK